MLFGVVLPKISHVETTASACDVMNAQPKVKAQTLPRTPQFAMATRRITPHLTPSSSSVAKFVLPALSLPRWASSSSSDGPSPSPKSVKKTGDRLSSVIDAVNDRKLPPELRGQRNAVRSETDIINVVEQRIWHSMEEGDFEKLPGKGKPLDLRTNPHADPAEDTLYRILSKNKCAPEWIELNKEIRNKVAEWKAALKKAWEHKCSGDATKWRECSDALQLQLRDINNMVFRYNLIVPFGRQIFGLKWEKELDRLKEEA